MAFKSWRSYWEFSKKISRSFRYIRDEETESFLKEVLIASESRRSVLEEGSILWRSQLGGAMRPIDPEDPELGEEPCPYPSMRMIPSRNFGLEGRANPKGISHLYLATEKDTAMAECRPWIGSQISLAQFKTKRDLNLVDCSKNYLENPFYFDVTKGIYEPDEAERAKAVWAHIDKAFSEPVTPNENIAHYAATQIIAELFKNHGYDGMVYKSMLGTGYNICLFQLEAAQLTGCQLYMTKKIEFSFEERFSPYLASRK